MGAAEASTHAARLARVAASVRDPKLRAAFVAHEVASRAPEDGALLLLVIAEASTVGAPAYRDLLLGAAVGLQARAHDRPRAALLEAARTLGYAEVVQLLERPAPTAAEAALGTAALRGPGRPLTLGERKALARRTDRALLARALRDPSPEVVRIVLGNPAVTEDDIVRMCARRPVPGALLRAVFEDARWIVRYGVKRAIAKNPCCPTDVATALLAQLPRQERAAIQAMPAIDETVRETCRRWACRGTVH